MTLSQPKPSKNSVESLDLWDTTDSLHPLIGAAPVAIVAVDNAGKILYVNQKLEELFGYSSIELLNNEVEMLMPKEFHGLHRQHRRGYTAEPHTRPMGSGMNLVGQCKDGREFFLEAGLSTVQISQKQVTIASIIDVSTRKQTEDMLEQRVVERTVELERRRRVADSLRDVLAVVNQDLSLEETLDYIVRQAGMLLQAEGCAIFQADIGEGTAVVQSHHGLVGSYPAQYQVDLTLEGAIGKSIRSGQPQAVGELSAIEATSRAIVGAATLCVATLSAGYETFQQNGMNALLSLPLIVQGDIYGALVLYYREPQHFSVEAIDLGVMFSDQAGLVIENAHLRVQAEEAAVAAERSRIARDLHDSVTQTLFSATIIADVLPRLWARNPVQARERLDELHELNRGALAEMRAMLLELRPSMLENADLDEVLQYLVDATSNRARIPVSLDIQGDTSLLPNEVRIALYRIVQEALNNVFRHARATMATVELICSPERVNMLIADDGKGFSLDSIVGEREGLRIMDDRASEIGAALTLASEHGNGTHISVVWHNESE